MGILSDDFDHRPQPVDGIELVRSINKQRDRKRQARNKRKALDRKMRNRRKR